jgi:hypothetical protein
LEKNEKGETPHDVAQKSSNTNVKATVRKYAEKIVAKEQVK